MPRRISTVRGREFAAGLRSAVDASTFTHNALSELLGWDHAKLSDLLNGKGGASEVELAKLLGVCRTPHAECDHLMALFLVSREKGWWQLHKGVLPIQLRTLIEHEDAATEIIEWNPIVVPGLLQTEDYMRALIRVWPTIAPANVEPRVAARVARQQILDRRRTFTFYIHENALRLPVGGPEVMSDQLHQLLRLSVRPYIHLRVVPTAVGAHAGITGEFRLMKLAKIEPVVYEESLNSCLFLEDKASIESYTKVLESLDRMALDEEESRRLITDIVV